MWLIISKASLPDSYFTPTTSELKAAYAAQVRVRENLINAPLKTQAMRESEEKAKQTKWLNTTIRVKFPDRTQLEKTFPSTDKIKSVYAFVRSALREDMKPNKFILYQAPPRREYKVSDPAVRDLNLSQLQLSPSSILLLSFVDEELNDPSLRAPLLEEVLARAQDLPPPPNYDQTPEPEDKKRKQTATTSSDASGEKKVPKWLKLGSKRSNTFCGSVV
ncbi:hypothetical protein SISNIDRAFT_412862 [Sistotremastrum niveocremeum HHB9708]|uniref:UBX domain-containing protein n=2 Tax=Sistotremastraceae TaxID=3402574 RepID=A0A164TRZ7_9AGAM|nr:hypothetical protein SISNIDRAFT_412862 [Sistotremastrum niveocremeum HHB9708]KZT42255.1 hypothetical protein SISSUDRAFT_980621 [Sistotremastrum suecicum HHB10207 ss-3]